MLWVDTDFGFDDLWALLLLKHHKASVAGVSLVAGNVPLSRAKQNALGAKAAFGLDYPFYEGAEKPLVRKAETAEAILGPTGMRTRGSTLPKVNPSERLGSAIPAMANWLISAKPEEKREILAIGPLTNIATLLHLYPRAAEQISRIVWMGGSKAGGNHTPHAEYNAFADPEAADKVMRSNLPLDVVDLSLCRSVSFGPDDLAPVDKLTDDLLGGYLDIALNRGRKAMAIYDPLAALACLFPADFAMEAVEMSTELVAGDRYGATLFKPSLIAKGHLLTKAPENAATRCLDALLKKEQ